MPMAMRNTQYAMSLTAEVCNTQYAICATGLSDAAYYAIRNGFRSQMRITQYATRNRPHRCCALSGEAGQRAAVLCVL